jgi:hypothetical protein
MMVAVSIGWLIHQGGCVCAVLCASAGSRTGCFFLGFAVAAACEFVLRTKGLREEMGGGK